MGSCPDTDIDLYEETRSITTPPPGWDAGPLQGFPSAFHWTYLIVGWYPYILLGEERKCESKLFCSRDTTE